MTWLLWRQHRQQGAVAAGLLLVLGVLLWITGVSMAHTLHTAMAACRADNTCDQLDLFHGDLVVIDLVNLTVLVPALVGIFWGATIVGRELDTGTNRLVWTQSITRASWLRAKLALLFLSSLAIGAALSGLVTWWSGTLNSYNHDRFTTLKFDLQGLAPVGYTLFASALGLAAGVLWRRTLPAIATTAGGFLLVRLLVEGFLRPHFQPQLLVNGPITGTRGGGPVGAWVFDQGLMLHGHVVTGRVALPSSCAPAAGKQGAFACLSRMGYTQYTRYQPAGRYWTFQWIEAGIFTGMAILLVAVAVVALRRQDA